MTITYPPSQFELKTAIAAATLLHDLIQKWRNPHIDQHLTRSGNSAGDLVFHLETALDEHSATQTIIREGRAERRREHHIDAQLEACAQ